MQRVVVASLVLAVAALLGAAAPAHAANASGDGDAMLVAIAVGPFALAVLVGLALLVRSLRSTGRSPRPHAH